MISRSSAGRSMNEYRLDGISSRYYIPVMRKWSDPEVTDQVAAFYAGLSDDEADAFDAAVDRLTEKGPALGRPTVGEVDLSLSGGHRVLSVDQRSTDGPRRKGTNRGDEADCPRPSEIQ
jgi:hypothetical protein